MFATINSFGVCALDGFAVRVEADISGGLPAFTIVGLPDNAVREATERVRSALKNALFTYPVSRITINLAPADIRKTGPVYDLPLLLAILVASGQIAPVPADCAFVGELSLDSKVRAVAGVLPMAITAYEQGIRHFFVPRENAQEAAIVEGLHVYAIDDASAVLRHLNGAEPLQPVPQTPLSTLAPVDVPDFADVRGQLEARRALEIAAAGNHNVLLIGPPGTGKSMLAKRLPSILPPMTQDEAIETTKIYSITGMTGKTTGLMQARPFRSPHHSVSASGLSGGGSIPRPGEISLAHNGVLFLDELPEFKRDALEILRQPIEEGTVNVSRALGTARFPCNVLLVAAMNPCPCGYFGHPTRQCTCTQFTIDRYLQRISGPLLDRIDLHVEVMPMEFNEIASDTQGEASNEILKRVLAARAIQEKRFAQTGVHTNADLPSAQVRKVCRMSADAQRILKAAFERMGLSGRAYDRVLKVSRTIADLDGSERIEMQHVAEAVQYRNLDRKYWHSN